MLLTKEKNSNFTFELEGLELFWRFDINGCHQSFKRERLGIVTGYFKSHIYAEVPRLDC